MIQKDPASGVDFWCARDLQMLLGYARWENFEKVIDKAITACKNSGYDPRYHFRDITKMVRVGSGAERAVNDIGLTRYACYLIAQNGDPGKDAIAFAQTYFAVQTRKQEIIEKRLAEAEGSARGRNLQFRRRSSQASSSTGWEPMRCFGRIRSKGDMALFGGRTTQDMKKKLAVPASRALADFLPTITIKAKDFANEITNFNIKQNGLQAELPITDEHVKNNAKFADF